MSEKQDVFDKIMMLPGLRNFFDLYKKHKSVLLYIFFGGLTTVVSIGSFVLCDSVLCIHPLLANLISWVCAVSFAYVTNRIWVFDSQAKGAGVIKEIFAFFSGRLLTLGLEEALLLVFVTWLQFNSTAIKLIAQIVVLVLNYVISKLLVFRKK